MPGKVYQASAKGLTAISFNRHFEPKEEPTKRLSAAQWAEWEEKVWQRAGERQDVLSDSAQQGREDVQIVAHYTR